MARLHAFWWNHELFGSTGFSSISQELIDQVVSVYNSEYQRFEQMLGDRLSDSRRQIYSKVLERLPFLLKNRMVGSKQLTLAHGDAHHWNFLQPADSTKMETIIFDWQNWQNWHIDTPAHDLAFLMGVCWFPEHRKRMEKKTLKSYLSEFNSRGINYQWDELWDDYRLSILRHLFTPVIFSAWLLPAVWWPHIERVFAAYDDLDCNDLI